MLMRNFTKVFVSLLLLCGAMNVSAKTESVDVVQYKISLAEADPVPATEVTWTSSEQNYANATVLETVALDSKINAVFDKGTNGTAPKYYDTGTAVRMYGGNTLTIKGGKVAITKVELTFSTGEGTNEITTDKGTYADGAWTPAMGEDNTNNVKFTVGGTSGHRRVATIKVTYVDDENAVVEEEVHIANTAETAYTVAEAVTLIDAGKALSETVFVKGIVSQVDKFDDANKYITYWISEDGKTEGQQFELYHGKGIEGADFTSEDDVKVGASVVVTGKLSKFGDTYELAAGNALVSYEAPKVAPLFAEGKYYIQNVTSSKFLGAANSWGTQASLVKNPDFVTLHNLESGEYTIESQVANGGSNYFFNGSYMDDGTALPVTIAKSGEDTYTLSNGADYFGYDGQTTILAKLAAENPNAVWKVFTEEQIFATLQTATQENPVDATFMITDHTFGRNHRNVSAWTNEGGCALTGGNSNKHCAEKYHGTFNVYQKLTNAPVGVYKLTAQGFYRQDGSDNDNLPVLYANNETVTLPLKTTSENSMADACASFEAGKFVLDPVFVQVTEAGELTVGVKLETNTTLWCIWDNFELTYYGAEATIDQIKNADILKELAELRTKATELKEQVEIESVKNEIGEALTATAEVSGAEAINAAINTLKTVVAKGEAYIAAKATLASMKALIDATNVYTEAALNEYYTQWVAKYTEGTLTTDEANALQDPTLGTGWHAALTVDNFLLSAWDTNPDFVDAPYYINSWSTEGNNDGSNFKVPFFEYWVSDASTLGEKTLTATMNGLTPGNYVVSAWVRVRLSNGKEAPATGITLQANDGEAVSVIGEENYGQFYLKNVEALGTVGEDGVLAIKFIVAADNNISWLSFKNVKFEVAIDKTALETAIADAKTAAEALTSARAKAYLDAAIAAAETVFEKAKTQDEIDAAVVALNDKVALAKEAEAYKFGQYAQYAWESPKGVMCEKGGVITYENGEGDRLNYQQAGYYTICLNGKKANMGADPASANSGYMLVTLDEPVQAGDVIRMSAFLNKNASKTASAWFVFENDATLAGEVYGDEANIYSGEDVTFNGVVTTKDVVVPAEAAGSKTIKITRNTAGTNLFITKLEVLRLPVDITLNVESGKDIAAELLAATEGKAVASITINLAEGGTYALDTTITTGVDFALVGNGSTITMAESRTDNFLTLDGTTEFALKADGTESDHKLIKTVSVSGVKVLGLKAALVRDNQKTLVETLTVENSVVEMPAAGKNVFDFNGKGYAGKLVVNNSTIYAAAANSGFFAQYGSRPKNVNSEWLQVFDIQNSTLVNIANGKNMCDLKQNGTAQNVYVVKNNIFVDCGKQNQVIVGLNKGQASATPSWDVDGNIFNWGGADVSAAEVEKAGKVAEEDIVKNSIAAVVTFADLAAGDLNATLALAEGAVAPETVGDPRWTVTVAGSGNEIADGVYELTADMFKVWDGCTATSQPTEETPGFGSNIGTEISNGALVYGNPSVVYLQYADATGYDSLAIVGTPGLQLRVLMNRLEVGNGGGDANGGALTEVNVTIGENGVAFVNFAGYEFVHINSIKLGWGCPAGIIEKIELVKGEYPEISGIDNIAAVAAQKDGKFFINGKLVIVRNGQQFNAKGQLIK